MEGSECILRYIEGTINVGFVFEKDTMGKQEWIGYVYSNYAGDLDKHQCTTGYIFILSQVSVSCRSFLQSVVALSSTEAEYMAMSETMKEAIWL